MKHRRTAVGVPAFVAAIVVTAVVVAAAIFAAAPFSTTVTKTVPKITTTTTTETSTLTVTQTTSENINASVDAALLAICSQAHGPPSGGWKLVTTTNSAAVVCLQLYYFNSTSTLTLNLDNALSLVSYPVCNSSGSCSSPSGVSNFTIITSQNQLVIGGPTNENEGTTLAYAITAKPGTDGAYQLSFTWPSGHPSWMLGPQPLNCGYYGEVVAGTGPAKPVAYYCVTYTTSYQSSSSVTNSTTQSPTIPGIQYPILSGDIYFQIMDVSNSTQIGGVG